MTEKEMREAEKKFPIKFVKVDTDEFLKNINKCSVEGCDEDATECPMIYCKKHCEEKCMININVEEKCTPPGDLH